MPLFEARRSRKQTANAAASAADDSNTKRLGEMVVRTPSYVRLAWQLIRDDSIRPPQKALLYIGVGYVMSPIDLVPGIIPFAGQIDDALVLLLTLRGVIATLPRAQAEHHLRLSGLTSEEMNRDLATLVRAGAAVAKTAGGVAIGAFGAATSTLRRKAITRRARRATRARRKAAGDSPARLA